MSALVAAASVAAYANGVTAMTVVVTRNGSLPSLKGSLDNFTGSVHVDPFFPARHPSTSGGFVTFEPGARSAWHAPPLGQTLIVTAGTRWVKNWNDQKQEMEPGDVVWIPLGVKHWYGAPATTGVSHIAVRQAVDGKNVEWMEKVSDEQFNE